MVLQVRQRAGHADEPHLAGFLQLHHRIEGAVLLQCLLRRRDMELHQVEIVGLHPHQALLDTGYDVVACKTCGLTWPTGAVAAPTRQPHLLAR